MGIKNQNQNRGANEDAGWIGAVAFGCRYAKSNPAGKIKTEIKNRELISRLSVSQHSGV